MSGDYVRLLRCRSCSAPLAGFRSQCGYCGTRNDIDRSLLQTDATVDHGPALPCPLCQSPMKAYALASREAKPIQVRKCEACFGLFFDLFKLETVLANLSRFGFSVDRGRLAELDGQPNTESGIAYRKCPTCAKLMNRENFGKRSGVIADRCGDHGTWLDAGELKRLVEWMDAGGSLVHTEMLREVEKEKAKRAKREREKLDRLKRQTPDTRDG